MEAGCERLQRNPQVIKLPRCRCNFAISKWEEMNGRKDEAVPAADGSWVLLPRRRNPPRRATPLCFYRCLLGSEFNQHVFTHPDSLPQNASEAKGGNMVYTITAIKRGWTGCNLGWEKKKKKESTHPTPSAAKGWYILWEVSLFLCIYIYIYI